MFEYHLNRLCVLGSWLYQDGEVVSENNYRNLTRRGMMNVIRRGCKGTPALVEFDSIPERFKKVIIEKTGDPREILKHSQFEKHLSPDREAAEYYSRYRLDDGRKLPQKNQLEYRTNAEILNAVIKAVNEQNAQRGALSSNSSKVWKKVSESVNGLDMVKYPHTLPTNHRSLQRKVKQYKKHGYYMLIHRGFCNGNSRKVTDQIESLILSLYAMPNKPYTTSIHELYLQFLGGAVDVVDVQTGELFDQADFYDQDDQPVIISEATVYNYINDPKNRVLVDKYRSDQHEFNNTHRPHHHRHKPEYSLSKVSMDDRDLPRKTLEGTRVKAYYAYDVLSQCVIGAAYSRTKDKPLFINAVRNMFRFLNEHGLGLPMEMEVEHHIVNKYKDGFMKAGVVFPFVRWCNPGNSQEKHAEHMNKTKKYGFEKKHQEGIGRWYAKTEANRTTSTKVFDELNNTYKEAQYPFDQLVADDMAINEELNNSLHPNQKKYKGMTRLEVLKAHVNPNLAEYDSSLLARYIGEKTSTSITRSQYVTVNYQKHELPSVEVFERLKPNNRRVDAYWIPGENQVHLYQDEVFIATCRPISTYNTATAEHTDRDKQAIEHQRAFVKAFDQMVKSDEKVNRVSLIKNDHVQEIEASEQEDYLHVSKATEDDFDMDEVYVSTRNPLDDL